MEMDKVDNRLDALSCEMDQLYQQLHSGLHDEAGQTEIEQQLREIQDRFRKVVDNELDV